MPAHACSDRYQADCAAKVQEEPGPAVNIKPAPRVKGSPRVRAPKPTQTARAEKQKKPKLARVRRHHRVAAVTERRPPAPTPSASERSESTASRRFRNFIDPQAFALNAAEELRKPRPSALHLAGQVADPSIIPAAWTASPQAPPQPDASAQAPSVPREQASGDDRPVAAPVVAQSDVAEARRAAPDGDQGRMSFLSWFFIAWGGVLTLASAFRLAVG
jgi:hypothetical protein